MTVFNQLTDSLLTQHVKQPLPDIHLGAGVLSALPDILSIYASYIIVADAPTWKAVNGLPHVMAADRLIFDTPPTDDISFATQLIERTRGHDAIVAVGSGTINDLCKYAAHQLGIPYVIIATAASMNGYLSSAASLSEQGVKSSRPATLPVALLADMDIIAAAPNRLNRAGLGDSLAGPTAHIDWLIGHYYFGEPYDPLPYELTEPYEKLVFNQAEAIGKNEPEALADLMRLLLLSGLGMSHVGSSRPASGAEHMVAHLLGNDALHGEQIAVTAPIIAGLQEQIIYGHTPPPLPSSSPRRRGSMPADTRHDNRFSQMVRITGEHVMTGSNDCKTTRIKGGMDPRLRGDDGIAIQTHLARIHLPAADMQHICVLAGLSTRPADVGWSEDELTQALEDAPASRDRRTCLDMIQSNEQL